MKSMYTLVFIVLGVYMIPYGYGLRCYSYVCSNPSVGPQQNCTAPKPLTCVADPSFPSLAPNRCLTQRIQMRMNTTVINQEIRNCSYSAQCDPSLVCRVANASMQWMISKCELGCCESDLCNSGGPIPSAAPQPTGPSGSALTCYSCADTPGMPGVASASCKKPVKQICDRDPNIGLPQDRCLTLTFKAKVEGTHLEITTMMKNCSLSAYCADTLCQAANVSGVLTSCKTSCCFGNLCNGPLASPTASAVGFGAGYVGHLISVAGVILVALIF